MLQKEKQDGDKNKQNADDDLKRLELLASQPEREAKANDLFVNTSKNLVETLRSELKAQSDANETSRVRYVQEITALRNEISGLDNAMSDERVKFRKEIQSLRNENTDLRIVGSDLAKGVEMLTEQLRQKGATALYQTKKETGPLLEPKSNGSIGE